MTATRTPAKRVRSVLDDAPQIAQFLGLETRKLARLLRAGRPGAAVGSIAELATGRNPYYAFRLEDRRYQPVSVGDHELVVDTTDAGISRTLLAYGVHEYRSSTAFERELERLAAAIDGPVRVLEVGANIGYFCTIEAGILGDRARIHAVEPIPSNVALLEHNLERNGYADLADVERLAFGDEERPVEMQLSTHSNQHQVRAGSTATDSVSAAGGVSSAADSTSSTATLEDGESETVAVEQTTGNRYLADRDVDPASINVVRFDVEGYESAVLEGLTDVLEAPGPTVVYVELHPLDLSSSAKAGVIDRFATNGFEIVSAVRTDAAAGVPDARRWHGLECDVESFDDLRRAMAESDHSIELIARK
ncbi:FkbM family methyltransferase [Natronorubrum texcoconense]|uniref:Methyltransferase, FkbM family n=1 Tax=Natronorubrum texcoconense TaxID=1095776 RepID=A0A1G8XE83_9EURY|nr:FkbM family methyltransferase [Natronorubrum texcoconense]SDJ88872.1 methyltransferase, FkbM family [Natronorubrum texcoconense]